ncbi:ribbon-helix-helix protein, CopG family [Ferrimonas balearica]|uniref:ribbon-helix-helix protein, CopG family n=1 Tax=Ferrimonas balearica TaxID=44012 RepID=UPI001C960DBD|nr:ribbon-helix-helix protein, CopG family [Ferrimonas balearica]MBY6226423.1 ribbon-helix-helix protein, CopG family [Ferrimonas balearica]
MATTKTATLTIRVEPNLKEALRTAAQAEHRSIANMVEVMIREHCEKNGIAIEHPQESAQGRERKQ